jgi:AMP-polyphosphate phosphotransferase
VRSWPWHILTAVSNDPELAMFASALQPHELEGTTRAEEEPKLRTGLIEAQLKLRDSACCSLLVVLAGPDGAGKGPLLFRLYEWLDSRSLRTNAYHLPTKADRLRPPFWRYWRDLPAKGEIGVVVGSWYNETLLRAADGQDDDAAFQRNLHRINAFEAMLVAEGVKLLKVMPFIGEAEEQKRLKVIKRKAHHFERHVLDEWGKGALRRQRIRAVAEEAVRLTSTDAAPWLVLPAADPDYRDIAFGHIVLDTLERNIAGNGGEQPTTAPAVIPSYARKNRLDDLDLGLSMRKTDYLARLDAAQERLFRLSATKHLLQVPVVIVFEGHDAAGKGGSIRRMVYALDPRRFTVHSIAAPSDDEKRRPYLWRFWRRLPAPGRIAVFDRSWYGRVLVERVEGFCTEAEWLRAYGEINAFEEQLVESNHVLVKFWLAIGKDEQLRRFEARQKTPFKQYKITDDDWRNRAKWDEYHQAIGDMLDRTSTSYARWTLIEAEDKRYGRVKVLETLIAALEARVSGR